MSVASDATNDEKLKSLERASLSLVGGSGGCPQTPFWAGGWEQSPWGAEQTAYGALIFRGLTIDQNQLDGVPVTTTRA